MMTNRHHDAAASLNTRHDCTKSSSSPGSVSSLSSVSSTNLIVGDMMGPMHENNTRDDDYDSQPHIPSPSSLFLRHSTIESGTPTPTTTITTSSAIDSSSSMICGLVAGIMQAGVFNPYDRALFLSIRDNRKFLHIENWMNPYSGFFQSIGGKALQGGLYFPFEHLCLQFVQKHTTTLRDSYDNIHSSSTSSASQLNHFLAGTTAGALNAIVLNPLSVIKYKTWGRDVNRGMWTEAAGILMKSGFSIRPFFNGLHPTLYRDVVFGGTYTCLRLQIPTILDEYYDYYVCRHQYIGLDNEDHMNVQHNGILLQKSNTKNGHCDNRDSNNLPRGRSTQHPYQWLSNMIAASLATIASGPFNYVRNVQYGTRSSQQVPSTLTVLHELATEIGQQDNIFRKVNHLTVKLRIGWGTARVAVGMSFAHAVYDTLYEQMTTNSAS